MDDKNLLRTDIKNLIKSLEVSYTKDADAKIIYNILNSEIYKAANTIFSYVNMGREINIQPIILDALKQGKTVCIPKCYPNMVMEARKITSLDDVINVGKMNVPEAKSSCPLIEKAHIDLSIVPCLAADKCGYRLGYGGGYYDSYLTDFKGDTILVCREKQLQKKIPVEPHDIPTDYYATEYGLFVHSEN